MIVLAEMLSLYIATAPISPQIHQETRLLWRSCADAPVEIAHAQVVVAGEKVYVGAGSTGEYRDSLKVLEYSTSDDVWGSLPPCSVSCFGMAMFRERLITVGGLGHTNSPTAMVFSFSRNSQSWEKTIPPMPTACSGLMVVTTASVIVAAGGRTDGGWLYAGVAVYNSDTSQWYTADPLPRPHAGMSSTVIDGTLYLMAGRGEGDFVEDCICVSLPSLIQKATLPASRSTASSAPLWRTLPPTPLGSSSAVCLKGSLVAIGGQSGGGRCSCDVHVFLDDEWVQLSSASLPVARSSCATVQLSQDEVIVIGGCSTLCTCSSDTYIGRIASTD